MIVIIILGINIGMYNHVHLIRESVDNNLILQDRALIVTNTVIVHHKLGGL